MATGNPYDATGVPAQRGWFARNALWFIPLLLLLSCGLCCGVCGLGGFATFMGLKDSEAYQLTLERVRSDERVIERLGEPITDGLIPTNANINLNATGEDTANFMFTVTGPKGSGTVTADLVAPGEEWQFTTLTVNFDDGEALNLLEEAGGGVNSALE